MTLSFCITCYDGDYELLPSLLKELQNQTEAPNEIIISASGRECQKTIQEYNSLLIRGNKVPVVLSHVEDRQIQSKARNRGVQFCSCDSIMFFDVDDIPHPQKIQICKEALQYSNSDALVHSYCQHPAEFKPIESFRVYTDLCSDLHSTNIFVSCCPDLRIHHAHILCRKNIFDVVGFNESKEFYRREDGKFCQDLLFHRFKLGFINENLVAYT